MRQGQPRGWDDDRLEAMRRRNRWLLVGLLVFVILFVAAAWIATFAQS